MNRKQLENIIIETLQNVGLYSPEAVQIILATAAHESKGGEFIRQYPVGPALGIFQIEKATFSDILNNYLANHETLREKIRQECNCFAMVADALVYNLKLSIVFCRLKYLMCPGELPAVGDWKNVAAYWKKYYNTPIGAGKVEEFLKSCADYGLI